MAPRKPLTRTEIQAMEDAHREWWRKTYLNESTSFTFPSLDKNSRGPISPLGGQAIVKQEKK
jgi:hypothetical protein